MININILKSIIIGVLLMQFQITATEYSVMKPKGSDSKKMISLKIVSFLSEDEKELNLQASPQRTILDVKNMIEQRTKVAPEFQELTFKEKELEDERILSYYIAQKSAELCVAERTKGMEFKFTSIKDNAPVAMETTSVPKGQNEGRCFKPGLNLAGRCKNKNCIALKNKHTLVPLGYSKKFNIGKEICKAKCPCCQKKLEDITTFMFSYCKYTIMGHSEESGEFTYSGTHTKKREIEAFLPSRHNAALETVYWMEVSVEKLN